MTSSFQKEKWNEFMEFQSQMLKYLTAKIASTEEGITEPEATFSACFGQTFPDITSIPLRKYLMFGLINTGWNVDAYVVGKRIKLKYSRAIIDAIHSGELAETEYENWKFLICKFKKHEPIRIPSPLPPPPSNLHLEHLSNWTSYMSKSNSKIVMRFRIREKEQADKKSNENDRSDSN
ncbi:7193_t:CDS:2 [Funneliformis mosseae]|uniref:7193_t:CDS:1 n=1 Tax=Funneliformis mosseae TaxID=27381 RepID=A0A9N8VV21_FUNMO|nr:7193_t:CDS:2 [Funneliformis mosseae]